MLLKGEPRLELTTIKKKDQVYYHNYDFLFQTIKTQFMKYWTKNLRDGIFIVSIMKWT